jgi:eukaryotic-like serine/threonine-protein kinase
VSTSAEAASRVGETLAEKYKITRYVGQGGMGSVYEAQHVIVGRRFAVKYLHAELAGDEEILERFRREARTAGALENENIVSVVDFGLAADGIPCIVMEYLTGEDLAALLAREGQLPVIRAVNIAIQACRGLDAAHAAGIVHRDLKPENLFICRRGDGTDLVKILDFGIAKLVPAGQGPAPSVTRSGTTMGTPFYMAPEQARGAKEVDHRADIYGLGVILFEALSGQKPHPGQSYNEILYHILTQPAVSITSLRPGLPVDLVGTIQQALAFNPHDRQASVAELARALSRHADRQVTPIRSQFELRIASVPLPDGTGTELRITRAAPSDGAATVEAATTATRAGARNRPVLVGVLLGILATATWLVVRQQGGCDHPQAANPVSSGSADARVLPRLGQPAPVVPDAQAADAAKPSTADVEPASRPAAMPGTGGQRGKPAKRSSRRLTGTDEAQPPSSPLFDEQNPYEK